MDVVTCRAKGAILLAVSNVPANKSIILTNLWERDYSVKKKGETFWIYGTSERSTQCLELNDYIVFTKSSFEILTPYQFDQNYDQCDTLGRTYG